MNQKQQTVYILGLVACAAGALVIALLAPSSSSTASVYELRVAGALSNWELNNDNAQGAPQQQVVNGWAAKDLLAIQAQQNSDLLKLAAQQDNRGPLLLMVLVFAVAWVGAWQPVLRHCPRDPEPPAEQPAETTVA